MPRDVAPSELALDPTSMSHLHRSWLGVGLKLAGAVIVLGLLYTLWRLWIQPYEAELDTTLQRIGNWAPLLFIVVFLFCTLLFFPESILAIAAGTIFGLWWGLLWVVLAGTLTAIVIFFLGRRVLQTWVERLLEAHPKIKAIDDAASQSGFKLAFLLRLAPVSFAMLNLLLAASRIRFRAYLLSCVGMFPGNLSTVYLGFAARHTADLTNQLKHGSEAAVHGSSLIHEISLYLGLAASLLCSLIIAKIAMKAVHTATLKQSNQATAA